MTIKDSLILKYFWLCTDTTQNELDIYKEQLKEGVNPRDIKIELGKKIVALYHPKELAEEAAREFEKIFSKKELPSQIPEYKMPAGKTSLVDLIIGAKLAKSKSATRRVIKQKGVKIDGKVVDDPSAVLNITKKEIIIQYGKKNFIKIIAK